MFWICLLPTRPNRRVDNRDQNSRTVTASLTRRPVSQIIQDLHDHGESQCSASGTNSGQRIPGRRRNTQNLYSKPRRKSKEREREAETERQGQKETETMRETQRQTDRRTDRQKDRQTEKNRDTDRHLITLDSQQK